MVVLSKKTRKLLRDDILSILYDKPLEARYTNEIALELRRDKEFVKNLLLEMKKEGYVEEVSKNKKGYSYQTRKRWRIPKQILEKLNQVYAK